MHERAGGGRRPCKAEATRRIPNGPSLPLNRESSNASLSDIIGNDNGSASTTSTASVTTLEKRTKANPRDTAAWKELAALLATQEGRLDEAQTLAEKARQALPGDPALARTLGIIRSRKGSFEPAISLLKESETKVPLDAEGLFYLGTSQLAAGQKDNGVTTLKRAVGMTGLPEALKQKAQESLDKIEAADKPAP